MEIYFSDSSFEVGNQSYEGFPILVDSKGKIVNVALDFFVDELLRKRSVKDVKTWNAYGRHLYDYFGYLEAKKLKWDYIPESGSGDVPPLVHYVSWCDKTIGNKPGYINDKTGLIQRFYVWALKVGLIPSLPFREIEVVSLHQEGMLSHTSSRSRKVKSTDLHIPEVENTLAVLSRRQIDLALRQIRNPTHRAMLHLGLNAGLRAEEIVTFPAEYVVDCGKLSAKVKSISVHLNPNSMDTKNDKSRKVRISVPCMNQLWQYRETVRSRLERTSTVNSPHLFLTRYGLPFVADGFDKPLARLGEKIGFHMYPHLLRHTFATHTLAALDDLKRAGRIKGSPLHILMGLLGHSSVLTTMKYVHQLDSIDDAYGTQYQSEIDALALAYLEERV